MKQTRLSFVCTVMGLSTVLCVFLQLLIDASYDNVLGCILSAIALGSFFSYLALSDAMQDSPISSLGLFGLSMSTMFVSLVAQTISLRPYVEGLRAPVETFQILGSVLVLATLTHYIYRRFSPLRGASQQIAKNVFGPLGLHDVPRPIFFWILTPIGYLSLVKGTASVGDVGGKLVQALGFIVWLPFAIPAFYRAFGERYCNISRQVPFLITHVVLVALIGAALNARQLMFIGPVTAALVYFVIASREKGPICAASVKRLFLIMAGVTIVSVGSTRLILSMEVAREKREYSSKVEMLKETYETLFDEERILRYEAQKELRSIFSPYDENYLKNPLLGRLSLTKFHDNMIFMSLRFNEDQRSALASDTVFKLTALLPQPVLDWLETGIDKNHSLFSIGDAYKEQAYGSGYGGFVSGSIWADTLTLGGDFWMLWVIAICLTSFLALDSMSLISPSYLVISPLAMALAWMVFTSGVESDSIYGKCFFLLRALPERIIIYLAFWNIFKFFYLRSNFRPEHVKA